MYAALAYELELPYNIAMNHPVMSPQQIQAMSGDQRYSLIEKLIRAEIDERVSEDFESSGYDSEEAYRDESIARFCDFLKDDLCSDSYRKGD